MHSHQMNTHLRTGPNYSCKVCHKEFKFFNTLKLHNQKMHIHSKKYECDWCGKCFLIKPYLRSHFKRHLTTGVRFKPKNHINFIHPRYEKHLPESAISQEMSNNKNKFPFEGEKLIEEYDIITPSDIKQEIVDDQNKFPFEEEKLIEEYEIIIPDDIKQEVVDDQMFIDYEICPMDGISGVIKEETEDDDREFLQAFLPRMNKMSEEEKKLFKRKAKLIAKKVLAMRF